ncbi:MAG: ABC transporter ATP-binding protein [Polyangia bacterium]
MSAIARLTKVTRLYDRTIALRDVTLELGTGTTGLLGPNGAGKSTLLRLLVGLMRPTSGEVLVGDRAPFDEPAVLRRIGYCPEHEHAYEGLSAVRFVQLMTELHGYSASDAEQRARTRLEAVGLADAMTRPLGTFSKGMRQRAKLAQALAHDPDLLVLDEPLTGCDPVSRARVLDVLRAEAKRGAAIVMSSHVLSEIEALTSRIVVLHRGEVLAEGDVHGIRALIDRHPHQVRVVSNGSRRLAERLSTVDHVISLKMPDAHTLVVETRRPDDLYDAVPLLAAELDVEIDSLSSPDDNMAAVFRYLTSEQGVTV